jgi:hypothetical protein
MLRNNKWFFLCIGLVLAGPVFYAAYYQYHLHPQLVLELPADQCPEIEFGPKEWHIRASGLNVDNVCLRALKIRSTEDIDAIFFATKGVKVKRFKPKEFRGVKVEVETVSGDENIVYFYKCHPRYSPTVHGP